MSFLVAWIVGWLFVIWVVHRLVYPRYREGRLGTDAAACLSAISVAMATLLQFLSVTRGSGVHIAGESSPRPPCPHFLPRDP